ncbi:MAG: methyltransferase [Phyllobacteriaceae bacterium]|nr:methyltransferase [Phyllobacteriaceae bacterium]
MATLPISGPDGVICRSNWRACAPQTLTLIESNAHALAAAKHNLEGAPIPVRFQWLDVTAEKIPGIYDWVVLNPPFHDALGHHAPHLGQAFIMAAAKVLKPGGKLLMVANRQLPYEATLATAFKSVEKLADADGFKVIQARK